MKNQSKLQLVQAIDHEGKNIPANRRWGDLGLLEIDLDTGDIHEDVEDLKGKNANIYTHVMHLSLGPFSYGYFTLMQDPEGSMVELVN